MNTNQIVNVVKSLKKTELVFDNNCRLRVGKSDIRWEPTPNGDELIIIYPQIREKEYRVLYSSASLDKHGSTTAEELIDFWESNDFFFDAVANQVLADGRAEFRADLPITIGFPAIGAIYIVEKPTTILAGLYTTYQSGLYMKDNDTGSLNDWRRLNIKTKFITSNFAIVDPNDQSKQWIFDVSSLVGVQTSIVPNEPQIIDRAERREFTNVLSTGLHEFNGGITVNGGDNTLIDIPALDATFINSTTDPLNPTFIDVAFAAKPAYNLTTTAAPGDFVAIYLSYDINGNVIEKIVPLTDEERRDYVDIGLVVRDGNDDSIFLIVKTISNFGLNIAAQFHDLLSALGTFNISGNDITPNANLTFNIDPGVMWQNGANALSNPKDPHRPLQLAETPTTFGLKLSDGTDIGITTLIDPTIWDNGTNTPATVTNNTFTVQRVARFPDTGFVEILLGQEQFNTKQLALDAIGAYLEREFVVPDDSKLSVPLYWLVVKKETTDLTDILDAEFVPIIGLVR